MTGVKARAALGTLYGDVPLVQPTSARFVAGFGKIVDIDGSKWAGLTEE